MGTVPSLVIRCRCGSLEGEFDGLPAKGARGVCHCADCQAWARWLGVDGIVDVNGGTEVIQAWPAQVRFTVGAEHLALARLSAKGLHRWYAGCCRSPVANTMGAGLPFTGVIRGALACDEAELGARYGRAHGVQGRYAPGGCPPGVMPTASVGVIAGAVQILARGWFAGGARPTPFFDDAAAPVREARVLTVAERAALG